MARYTGPKVKIARRLGVNIFENEKGARALDRRPYPPGEHGRDGHRRQRLSPYGAQLQEKQKLRFAYGILERQFRRLYEEANRRHGITGHNLLRLLELRVDNIVFRAGWARTRPQARQLVSHGLVLVNGRRITVPGRRLHAGDEVALSRRAREMIIIRHNLDTLDRMVPAWLSRSADGSSVAIAQEPDRDQIDTGVNESLVVELYSR